MKFSILLLLSLVGFTAQASEVVLNCHLRALPEMEEEGVHITGTFSIEKTTNGTLLMQARAVSTEDGEDGNNIEVDDVGTRKLWNESTKPSAEDYVSSQDDLNGMREMLLPEQSLTEFLVYSGKNFRDDGAGLNLLKFTAKTGKTAMIVNVGWSFLLCE